MPHLARTTRLGSAPSLRRRSPRSARAGVSAMPEPEPPRFCGGIDWTTGDDSWRCDGVVQDGDRVVHQCAASYDHVEYEGEAHVCALGHRWPVYRPRRRLWDWLLRRPVE